MSIWGDIWTNIQAAADVYSGVTPGATAVDVNQTPEAQQAVNYTGFFGGLTAFITALTDAATWISLGWLLLGCVLIFAGIRSWLGKSPLPAPPSIVPVPL